ncbi:MAG: hypothetical protein ACI4TZ_00310 [Christensenellales bacterium]
MRQKIVSANKKTKIELILITLSVFIVLCLLGSTLAWFTNNNQLTGEGTTPNASVSLYSNGAFVNGGSGNSGDVVAVTGPVFNKNIARDTTSLSGSVQFDCSGSNIDLLAVVSVAVNFFEADTTTLVNGASGWASLSISSNFTLGADGRYYYNSKISKDSVANKISIFDTITINNSNAEGKDLQIVVYVDVVQANQTGLNKLTQSGYSLPSTFTSLV